jgi:flavodoxin I
MKIGIYYGSTMGNTERIAGFLAGELAGVGDVTVHDVGQDGIADMASHDLILLGSSTWGLGDLQDDWLPYETLPGMDLAGRKAAVFGAGDQQGYSDTFADALAILAEALEKAGATLIGAWPVEDYEFAESRAVRDGRFLGLALDEDNQADRTEARVAKWAAQLKTELGV